jgi:hypothetical protein
MCNIPASQAYARIKKWHDNLRARNTRGGNKKYYGRYRSCGRKRGIIK